MNYQFPSIDQENKSFVEKGQEGFTGRLESMYKNLKKNVKKKNTNLQQERPPPFFLFKTGKPSINKKTYAPAQIFFVFVF